ncbi:MAG: metalloregulator ArsR/SmtB family transcription factor [Thermoanaerobaculia bacterium]|nr:metalloregulator ArsR/SmtB family transcription factor [Thermoanaerobaculia bacterium]
MESELAISRLAALAHPTRLDLFRRLVRQGPAGEPAGAIAAALGVPGPTLSFHLAALARAGLVAARRKGRSVHYAADYHAIEALVGYLTENCCAETGCCPPATAPIPARGEKTRSSS